MTTSSLFVDQLSSSMEDSHHRNLLSSMPCIAYEAVACKIQKIQFHVSVKDKIDK